LILSLDHHGFSIEAAKLVHAVNANKSQVEQE